MTLDDSQDSSAHESLRQRLAADVAAGRTVSVSAEEMARPELRERLPELLSQLGQMHESASAQRLTMPGYTVLAEIGHGGMSTVYLARHERLGRFVALKVVPNWVGGQERARQRLLTEARAMARVEHANIVTIHDVVDDGVCVAIAMEWVDGLTLSALLRHLPAKPSADDLAILRASLGAPADAAKAFGDSAMRWFVQVMHDIARAVQHVHDAGLLHLDVKPSNILVRRDGTPLLADFGVVREIDVLATNTRSFAGTPIYSAPEQLRRDDRSFGPRTDVYGLGITLYELLARERPVQQEGLTRLLQDLEAGRIPPLASRAEVPADLANIVHKAIAPEPPRRYATAAAFADDLLAFLQHRPVTARPWSRLERFQRWVRVEPLKALLVAVLLVTVPVVLALGTKLLLDMPRIADAERRERETAARLLVHRAFQSYFSMSGGQETSVETLRRSLDLAPEARTLASLVVMLGEQDRLAALAELRRNVDRHPDQLCLQLLAETYAGGHSYLSDTAVEQLRDSRDQQDQLALVLDRVLWAEDRAHEEAFEAILPIIQAACLATPEADPLLHGMLCWAASRAQDREVLDDARRAIEAVWPDDYHMMTWQYLALDPYDPAAAAHVARDFLARHPSDPRPWHLLAHSATHKLDPAAALAVFDEAEAAGVPRDELLVSRAILCNKAGKRDEAAACLEAVPAGQATLATLVRFHTHSDPAEAIRIARRHLQGPRTAPHDLVTILELAQKTKDGELMQEALQRAERDFPDRHIFRRYRGIERWMAGDKPGAAQALREITMWRHRIDSDGPLLTDLFAVAKDWQGVRTAAERWLQYGRRDTWKALHYLGLAHSRLGDARKAIEYLDRHLTEAPTGRAYANATIERAWIEVDPNGVPELRNPKRGLGCFRRIDQYHEQRGVEMGPWTLLVKAEAYFANGDHGNAVKSAEAALARAEQPEPHAPADLPARAVAALERYKNR